MGRVLKRVPLDFSWPIGMLWKGYVNPYRSQKCETCDGTGHNEGTKKIDDEWYAFDNAEYVDLPNGKRYNKNAHSHNITETEIKALLERGRLSDFTRDDPDYVPTPEEVNEWSWSGFGHDASNAWICVEARAKELGVWGKCPVCNGDGEIYHTEEIKKLSKDWEGYEPPEGEGYQLWETTSEGSPKSPVFETLEELCEWCESNVTTFADHKATKEEWFKMLSDGLVYHQEGNFVFL